ncbi:MAG: hypothetical protein E6J71_19610 [Deltaproteobacteria bacterium]|nr:MAG: hypothetical protein E6J71_19610 [Deltaproteobacteria bacterium]
MRGRTTRAHHGERRAGTRPHFRKGWDGDARAGIEGLQPRRRIPRGHRLQPPPPRRHRSAARPGEAAARNARENSPATGIRRPARLGHRHGRSRPRHGTHLRAHAGLRRDRHSALTPSETGRQATTQQRSAARSRRVSLCAPAASQRTLAKAQTIGADEVVIDLEDAVPSDQKAAARQRALAALNTSTWRAPLVSVRVNAPGTPWCHEDVIALATAPVRPASLIVPKVEAAGDLVFVSRLLDGVERASGAPMPLTPTTSMRSERSTDRLRSTKRWPTGISTSSGQPFTIAPRAPWCRVRLGSWSPGRP